MRHQRIPAAAAVLLADVAADPWGQVARSWYDTGRLVALAPWLPGHPARVDFLCRHQRADGGWGGPEGYALVPTLSATAALLTELRRGGPAAQLAPVVARGLRALRTWLAPETALPVPDTVAVELVVPALLTELSQLLAGPRLPGLPSPARSWLRLPAGFDARPLGQARSLFDAGALPRKSWACLEVLGPAAVAATGVRPADGCVGCSAAATAAWLGGPDGDPTAVSFLDRLQARGGGPVPAVTPITYFEIAWVLNSLAPCGLARRVPKALLSRLETGLTAAGAPAAPGLPSDADDTAAVLAALLRCGQVRRPEPLLRFREHGYFACFPGERNPSVSTNAHVLEALALYLERRPDERSAFGAPASQAARWLLAQQRPDGSWWDKWHASGYYATACCVLALARHGTRAARWAIDKAAAWVLDTQRPDGAWGRWEGTVEETAYAVQVLSHAPPDEAVAAAVKRGGAYLADPPAPAAQPPLWHAKDLYTPVAVVRAARLAGLRLAAGGQVPDRIVS